MKKQIIFSGTATALITPFASGEIDYPSLFRLIDGQIAAGIDALVVGGTTGEAATLSLTERYELYGKCREHINGRCKLIFGTGTNDTRCAVAHTKEAGAIGCDGVLVVTPYYNKGTHEGVVRHYLEIADASPVPVLLYNVPSRTGVNLTLSQLERLSRHEMISGIKEAGDSVDRLVEIATLGEDLPLYSGNDSQIFATMALGGYGVISVLSNLLPKETKRITELYLGGSIEKSRERQFELLPIIKSLFLETNPAPVKYAMSLCGACSPELRLPLSQPSEATKAVVRGALSAYKK
ncbi:MAG: 4-hydroxy-tetrahydrodipicolinate synthase [Clostridia bacterium]|nr:4-hydroxy-tetrahydrodipicolinate synthase [Clostridia bacterium]